jgi:RNA polymerase sigma-70 factor (ECF subfamily)
VAEPARVEPDGLVTAAVAGDPGAFSRLTEQYRREIHVHCYRMLGSFHEAEDLVQETLLRAWRGRSSFAGRATFRAWLYGIATNACLDHLRRSRRRALPHQLGRPGESDAPEYPDVAWLQPYPDALLEEADPERLTIAKETVSLAFLAAIQLLTPRQRAVLLLREVSGWTGPEIAAVLDCSLAAVDSALQRARATLQRNTLADRHDWSAPPSTEQEDRLLGRYIAAHEAADADALAHLLADTARFAMPPRAVWFEGRDAVVAEFRRGWGPDRTGDWRLVPTRANRQPAAAAYLRAWGDGAYRSFGIVVLGPSDAGISEITVFACPDLFPAFGCPSTLP